MEQQANTTPSQQEDSEDHQVFQNEQDKKLFELRLKLNKARKENLEEVFFEKLHEDQELAKQTLPIKHYKTKKQIRSEKEDVNITAEKAQGILKENKQKEKPKLEGWEVFNSDSSYRAQKKRITEAEHGKQKAVDASSEEFRLQRMVNELERNTQKKQEYSRRRTTISDQDVYHVNEKNRQFNQNLSKYYDKATAEIKQNLERGSAI